MNHRERVLTALAQEVPDRVPIDLGSTRNTGILQAPYAALTTYLGLEAKEDTGTHGIGQVLGLATPTEAVLEQLDVDLRGLFLGKADTATERLWQSEREGEWLHRDEFGVLRRRPPGGHYFDLLRPPLDGEITVSDITAHPWPDPTDPGIVRGLRKRALQLRQATDYAVVLHLTDILVHTSQYMRGFESWYMDLLLAPDLLGALMDAILEIRLEVARRALAEVGDLIDVVSCADDVADQRGPQMSLPLYRRLIKPRHARYIDQLRAMTSATVLYHSCGSVVDLIPDFIDMGIQALNPIQVTARGMDPGRLKAAYGNQLVFWGAVDTMQVLPFGTPADVRAEVRRRKRELGPEGYILAAVHNLQPDVPAENIAAMYAEAQAPWET